MSEDRDKLLELMQDRLIHELLRKIENGEANASDLNVARQLLKDNNVGSLPTPKNPMGQLRDSLPFPGEEEGNEYGSH